VIDAHNHLHDSRFEGRQAEVIDAMKEAGITGCVVNGTCEDDWPEVARLADKFPDFISPAFGLHPWKVEIRSSDWLDKLTALLEKYPRASLGECGLDRWIKNPDLAAQHDVFREQLSLAIKLNRPTTIHCLKAWGPLLDELKTAPPLPEFLLHSFGGSSEIARECLKLGGHFSFSGHFLHPRKTKIREIFSKLPGDRVLVETDAPDMALPMPRFQFENLNHPANLAMISSELSKICKLPQETFAVNTRRFFSMPDQ